jgi:cytidylate kinase
VSARSFIVAIDGPAGAGKSTVSKILASRLGFTLVDTGAIYRCAALIARREGLEENQGPALLNRLAEMDLSFRITGEENRVFLSGVEVTAEIRTPEISMAASRISSRPAVRQALLPLQRRLARQAERGAVLEGRDVGTVVFPEAEAKFFLDAAPEVRAGRRHQELCRSGKQSSVEEVLADQTRRDRDDSSRAIAPLKAAEDAIWVDSSELSIAAVVQLLETIIRARMSQTESVKPGPT